MANPNDVMIDIPMTKVTSRTGVRKTNTISPVATKQISNDFSDSFDEKQAHSHFHHTQAGRRKRLESQARENKDSQDGTLTTTGKIYMKIFNFSVITRYFLYVAPVAVCIAVPMVVGGTVAPGARIGGVKLVWFFTWVEVVWVSLWVSKLVAQFLPYVFQFLCGVVSPGTRKYAAVITNLEIPLSLVGWAVTSLATFAVLMTQNPDARARNSTGLKPWQTVVKNILFACVFSTLVVLAEKFLIQLISISYHRKQFDDKIKDSKRNIHLVSLLYDASRSLFPAYCTEFAEEDYIMSDVLDIGSSGKNSRASHKRSGSNTPMKLIQGVGRVKDGVTSVFGHVAQEVTGKQVFNPNAAHSIVVQALEKKHTTEALARRLWLSFVLEGRDALYPDDIADVLGSDRLEEAEEAFYCLDADGNGDISLDEMILRLTEFGRDRMSITHSMRDVDQAIAVLDSLLLTVVFIMVVLIFVAFLNRNFTTTLATTGTALLSLSFVFATTAQEVLGSCIFLFVKHPFDVGDRVDVGEAQYVVERISLLYTMFKCVKNYKRTQVPNIVLNSLWIDNVSRSKAMREMVLLYVNFDTTLEDIELLKTEMATFVKENPRDFQYDIDIEVTGIAEMNKLELKVEIKHKSNWANETVRAARRSKFMCALVLALRKVPIYGPGAGGASAGDKANPTYSVAITDGEAKSNAKTFGDDKAKKRMDYSDKKDASSAGKSSSIDFLKGSNVGAREAKEQTAMDGLNQRNVAADPTRDQDLREETDLEKQRSHDIEEVRGILRKESTTGRRRANSTLAPESQARLGARTIPTIPDASPAELIQAPSQYPRVSYFEDAPYVPVPAPVAPPRSDLAPHPLHPTARGSSQGLNAHPPRADSATIPPSMAQIQAPPPATSSNPYYNKGLPQEPPTHEQPRTRDRSTTPTQGRKPVPGINEMKDYLQSPR